MNPLTIPDGVEPIVAWRSWQIARESEGNGIDVPKVKFRLASLMSLTLWPPMQAMTARCLAREFHIGPGGFNVFPTPPNAPLMPDLPIHQHVPEEKCTCGIYALTPDYPIPVIAGLTRGFVLGEVLLWGKILEGEKGYRAEYAYPKSLKVALGGLSPAEAAQTMSDLEAYGVPLEVLVPPDFSQRLPVAPLSPSWQGTALRLLCLVAGGAGGYSVGYLIGQLIDWWMS